MEMVDRSVIVTGGASGIGRATALLLAREGARVFVGDMTRRPGARLAAEARAAGLPVAFHPLELTDPASVARFAATVHGQVPCLDGLVNAAGWDRIEPFMENAPEMWDRVIAINLMGAVRLSRLVLAPMVERNRGKIVNVASSDAGRVGSMGRDGLRRARRAASSPSPNRSPAKWHATGSTSTASAPARPTRRCSRRSPSGCRRR